ncbi:MAG: DUF4920 domain-containing protein [Planctomycetota bacterium]|jgi:hypothetical protein|nr:DUF4920 domain-containing protein [Planctomycetota bacterium]
MPHRLLQIMLSATLTFGALALSLGCSAEPRPKVSGWEAFGAQISEGQPLSLTELLSDPEQYNGKTVLLEAPIAECCQNKGCWMTFELEEQSVRVKFLDYGFFVPLDSAGHTARLEGVFAIRDIPADEARHYLEDAGHLEEAAAISEPQRGFEIIANGVLLTSES